MNPTEKRHTKSLVADNLRDAHAFISAAGAAGRAHAPGATDADRVGATAHTS